MVCTANICRSPLAEAMLRDEAERRLSDPDAVQIRSAGVRGLVGEPVPAEMQAQAERRGLDLRSHRGAAVSRRDLEDADLVLTMTARQRDYLAAQDPQAEARIFTVKEFARLAENLGPLAERPPAERVMEAVATAHAGRPFVPGPLAADAENVADPYGLDDEAYGAAAQEIAGCVDVIAEFLFGEG